MSKIICFMLPFMFVISLMFVKLLIDISRQNVCNKRNRKMKKFPNCQRYMILAHINNFRLMYPISFDALTDYTAPRYDIKEHFFIPNEITFTEANIKPQPWCYDMVNTVLKEMELSFNKNISHTDDVRYDLYLMSGKDMTERYIKKIFNGLKSDIMGYDFSQDL